MKMNQQKLVAIILISVTLAACNESPRKSKENTKNDSSPQQTQEQTSQDQTTQIKQDALQQQAIEQLTQEEKDSINALEWALSANVDKDFDESIQKKDFRVWVIAGRGTTMPGIDISQKSEIDKICGHKYLPGVGDTLRGDTHRAYRQKAVEYATQFNQKMQAHCLSNNNLRN